jgi:hypothetical protein
MSKAAAFLGSVASATAKQESALETLANSMKEAGDSRLADELAKGVNEKGLLILAYGLMKNGDDRLWKQLDLETRIKESAEVKAAIEAIEADEAAASKSDTAAGRFLASVQG